LAKSDKDKCRLCGRPKEVSFEGIGAQYPVYSCPEHGADRNEWAVWWEEYSERWLVDANWDKPAERLSCLVGFFCHVFKEFYNRPYVFSYENPCPYKGKDFTMARRILAMFNGSAREARTYIRWVFAKRVRTADRTVSSLGFFASAKFVNEYLHAKARAKTLRRSTPLPQEFLQWCHENCSVIFDRQELVSWNDLNGLVTHVRSYGSDNCEGTVVFEAVRRGMLPAKDEYRKLED
jgi:hypothetical protein